MLSVLNWKVREQLSVHHHEDDREIGASSHQSESLNEEEHMAELIEVVVQQLAEWAAVIGPASLLPVDGV